MGNTGIPGCPKIPNFSDEEQEDGEFDSKYEVSNGTCIGTGKFGQVHLCWHRDQPERRFALKVITKPDDDFTLESRILDEVKILKIIGAHSGIVSLVDVDETLMSSIRLVLELCEGGELYDRIQQKKYYPEPEAKTCCQNLLEAVAYIHHKGIMHRDLKPENILLASKASDTDVKISDFGLAKVSRDHPPQFPRSRSICGSDFYIAPEIIKQEEYGREIDIWAVGVIVYVLLSGSLPFFHAELHKLYRQIVERDVSFPDDTWKRVSKSAIDFILRLFQLRPSDRITAEQALNHPWIRSTNVGSSFNSIDSQRAMVRAGSNGSVSNLAPSTTAYWNPMQQKLRGAPDNHQQTPSLSRPLHPLEYAHPLVGGDSSCLLSGGVAGGCLSREHKSHPMHAGPGQNNGRSGTTHGPQHYVIRS